MKLNLLRKNLCIVLIAIIVFVLNISAQTTNEEKHINFSHSPNPKTKTEKQAQTKDQTTEEAKVVPVKLDQDKTSNIDQNDSEQEKVSDEEAKKTETAKIRIAKDPKSNIEEDNKFESESLTGKTLEVAVNENKKNISPTEIYKIGIGDILYISLQNAPANVSTYFTVLNNGTIDYPLAGEMTFVLGLTPEEIEAELRKNIKLYDNPQISVKVREHSSHSITVLGLVEKPGIKYLQREAVPLFIIRAEAITQTRANRVAIRRAENDQTEQFSLLDSKNDEVLIYPGDIVEFSSVVMEEETNKSPQFYYIGGAVKSVGQKTFYSGITLTQAILASGGLSKSKINKVIIRRKNKEGLLDSFEYNLKEIKLGKIPDPLLEVGDTIEVED